MERWVSSIRIPVAGINNNNLLKLLHLDVTCNKYSIRIQSTSYLTIAISTLFACLTMAVEEPLGRTQFSTIS